ncbi:M14 family zinc carboxypeptidase [Longimonas sp.]|uniref:M14 family zinc carboxypeptidase n=1 Tax=Longimonas sp. TaxID=2039626 RepID=UPI003975D73C
MRVATRFVALLTLVLLIAGPASAQAQAPAFEDVTGHAFGERVTQAYQMQDYLQAVANASDRVVVEQSGTSWQGRPLMHAIVTAPENHARLDEIQANAQALGDPRDLSDAEAESIIEDQPAVFWFGGSIHGFELSGSEAALKMLERLATQDDAVTQSILENTVVIIDPMLNPDGRDAFAHHNHNNMGADANPDNQDWANDFTSWEALKYRTSHYYFDINRDWFAHTHKETQARVPVLQDWRPQAGIDSHEMGSDVEFYVDPPTGPVGPFFPEFASRWFESFGDAHAASLDTLGTDYMTRERYNYFYPGYTTSYMSYQGAVGMLYEQGSSRGLALTRPDGTVRTLGDAIQNPYTGFVAALEHTASERETLLTEYVQAHREAIADGEDGTQRYVLTDESGDPHLLAEAVDLLRRNGIEVDRLTESAQLSNVQDRTGASVGSRSFEAGAYVVDAAQPRNRLIRALLEPNVPVPQDFLEEARDRVDRGENPRFYDITAWSLPMLFGIEGYSTSDGSGLSAERVTVSAASESAVQGGEASYAYLIDGTQTAGLPALLDLKEHGHRVAMLQESTRVNGEDYTAGTGIVYAGQSGASVHDDMRDVADQYGLQVEAVGTGLAEGDRPSLGSGQVIYLDTPSVALLAEEGIQAYSFGWAWFTLDRQYDVDASVLRTRSLGRADLSEYDTIVLPETYGTEAIEREAGESGLERLTQWVQDGGTLVTLGSGTDVARDLELIALRSWYDDEERADSLRVSVPGAMVATDIDRNHWLTAGVPDDFHGLVDSNRLYLPPEGAPNPGQRAGIRYATDGDFTYSGHMWSESEARLPGAVFAYEERVGSGRVIAFAEDLNYRGYLRSGNRLFLNAVLVGPQAP